jgi:hypothetical protein
MAKAGCRSCGATEHCYPDCPTLRWTDSGELRGSNPGQPPARSLLLGDEMAEIFASVVTVQEDEV